MLLQTLNTISRYGGEKDGWENEPNWHTDGARIINVKYFISNMDMDGAAKNYGDGKMGIKIYVILLSHILIIWVSDCSVSILYTVIQIRLTLRHIIKHVWFMYT